MKFDLKKTRNFLKEPGMLDMTMACVFLVLAQMFPSNHHSDDWFNGMAYGFFVGIAFALVINTVNRIKGEQQRPDSPPNP
jgi:uncharacterized membrane-anchored protein YitT (DUF2179 family)